MAFLVYLSTACAYLGLPPLLEGGSQYVGGDYNPQIFIWSFAWWPHAVGHGLNPFTTHAVWAPVGVHTMWSTTVPGLALAFTPLTVLVGPVLSYDVAAVLMPALTAWAAFLLCRYLTRSFWPSLAGGYLFGFSSYVLAEGGGGREPEPERRVRGAARRARRPPLPRREARRAGARRSDWARCLRCSS